MVFERPLAYKAFYIPFLASDGVQIGLDWLLDQPGERVVALHAKKMVSNDHLLAAAVSRHRLTVVAPPRVFIPAWVGGAVLVPWASQRVLDAVDAELGQQATGVCVIESTVGSLEWVTARGAVNLADPSAARLAPTLDPVVIVALKHAGSTINHNNALTTQDDRGYVIRTLQLLVTGGYVYDSEQLCAWCSANGWAPEEVVEMRKIAPRVLQGAKFVLHDNRGPGAQALVRWEAEAGGQG